MSKIENLLDVLKKELFRFHERLEANMTKFSLIDSLLPLFLIFQLFIYSLHQVLIHFNHYILNDAINQIIQVGLVILQADTYSPVFHLAVSCASAFVVGLFVVQALRGRSKCAREVIDLMMLLVAFLSYISPMYFIVLPNHLINLFTQQIPPYTTINIILLPCYLLFFVSCLFLQYSSSLITPFHLLIPIFDYLGYDGLSLNGMIAGCAIFSYLKVLNGPWFHRMLSLLLIQINLWAMLEIFVGEFNTSEEVMVLVVMAWVVVGCFVGGRSEKTTRQQVSELADMIKSVEKPETQKREHYMESIFIEHFINCQGKEESFCHGYANGKTRKLLLQMPRQSLLNMLEQKLETDFRLTRKVELEIMLTEFRFLSKNKYLKLYKQSHEKAAKSTGKSFVEVYQHYKMMSKFRRRLEKESSGNAVVIEKIKRAAEEDQIFNSMLKQLFRLKNLWQCCSTANHQCLQPTLALIISQNQRIQHRFKTLSQTHYIKKQPLYDLFCEVFSLQKFSSSHANIQLSSQQQQPIYLLTLGHTIKKASKAFQIAYHYSQEQLQDQHVNILLPKILHSMHDQRFKEWNGAEITDKKLKFLVNGKGFVNVFGFVLLIYPDFEDGLRYISYMEPSSERRTFLYNIKDDHFQQFSEELIKEMTENGFSGERADQLRCQDLLHGLDLKNIGTRERLKNPMNCIFTKQKTPTVMSIKLLNEYQSGNGHYALLSLTKEEDTHQNHHLMQQFKRTDLKCSKTITQKIKIHERVSQIKQQIRQDSKLVSKIFVVNLLFVVMIAAYFTYTFVTANNSLTQYFQIQNQTQLKLQIRLLFAQIVLRNTQLYTINNIPSNISPTKKSQLISAEKSVIADRVDRINSDVLQRLSDPAHYQMLTLIEQITDDTQDGRLTTILGNVEKIRELLELPKSGLVREEEGQREMGQGVAIGVVAIVLLVFWAVNMFMTVRIEALIPKLKDMFLATKRSIVKAKIKDVENAIRKFDYLEQDTRKNELELRLEMQQGGKSNNYCSNVFCRVFILNLLIILVCLSCTGVIGGISGLQSNFTNQGILIDQFQNYFFQRSLQMVRVVFFTNLHFDDMYKNLPQPTLHYQLFLNQIDDINRRDQQTQTSLLKLNSIFSNISNIAWAAANKDICSNFAVNSTPCPSILFYGKFKSIIHLQTQLRQLNLLSDATTRYDNDTLIDCQHLSQVLSQYNRRLYLDYTNQIRLYKEQSLNKNLLVFLVMLVVAVVYVVAVFGDRVRKAERVNVLKELFVLIPCEEFQLQAKVRVFTVDEDILEIVKNI